MNSTTLYLLVLLLFVAGMAAQAGVRSTFQKYNAHSSSSGLTGAMAAERILYSAGITDVRVVPIAGELTDNYDPREKVLHLSQSTYYSGSVAAIGVAAHECGHAIQHHKNYVPIRLRNQVLPAAMLGSNSALPLFLLGLFTSIRPLIYVGIILFGATTLFQLVTLPVELDASKRALEILEDDRILTTQEVGGARKVLIAAAMTYVVAALTSIVQLLRLVAMSQNRRRD